MREIRFRMWDNRDKRMVYDGTIAGNVSLSLSFFGEVFADAVEQLRAKVVEKWCKADGIDPVPECNYVLGTLRDRFTIFATALGALEVNHA